MGATLLLLQHVRVCNESSISESALAGMTIPAIVSVSLPVTKPWLSQKPTRLHSRSQPNHRC
jgi:hypothetical protein